MSNETLVTAVGIGDSLYKLTTEDSQTNITKIAAKIADACEGNVVTIANDVASKVLDTCNNVTISLVENLGQRVPIDPENPFNCIQNVICNYDLSPGSKITLGLLLLATLVGLAYGIYKCQTSTKCFGLFKQQSGDSIGDKKTEQTELQPLSDTAKKVYGSTAV